jgi:hypothetical protein
MKLEMTLTQEKAVVIASLHHRFQTGFDYLETATESLEELVSVVDMLGSLAYAQWVYDQDHKLLATKRNALASLWLLFVEQNQEVTKGR